MTRPISVPPERFPVSGAMSVGGTLALVLVSLSLAAGNPEAPEETRTLDNEKEAGVNAEYRHSVPGSKAAPIDRKLYEATRTASFAAG